MTQMTREELMSKMAELLVVSYVAEEFYASSQSLEVREK
jgi:hypothetical protein